MQLDLYYVVRKYTHSSKTELAKPIFVAGPMESYAEAFDYILDRFKYNRDSYVIARQVIDVEEL